MPKSPRQLTVEYVSTTINDQITRSDKISSSSTIRRTSAKTILIEQHAVDRLEMTTENNKNDVEIDVHKEWTNGDNKLEQNVGKPNLKGDKFNLALLILLCTLQGIPLGISVAIRMYMQNRKISYVQQAKFSAVDLPYSLKLLWAPMVDAAYSRRIGKRKSWLIPVEILIGLSYFFIGSNINDWLVEDTPHMTMLTSVFFCVNSLAATQDIIVDGWALTLLRRENVGYASTCNTSGQALGLAFGYVLFILFESEDFCNRWLRFTPQKGGIISMEGYLYFWGFIFVAVSLSIALFKKEKCDNPDKFIRMNVTQTYKLLWEIINLQTIKKFTLVMLAYEVAFSSMGSTIANPKFMEYGVHKEDIALVDMSLFPIRIIIPILISKYTTGPTPLKMFYKTVPYRLVMGLVSAVLVYYTPYFVSSYPGNNGSLIFFSIYEFHRIMRLVLSIVIYLGVQSFFLRISDPRIGGTYMSLLNTIWHLGMGVARMAALALLNMLTIKQCSMDETNVCRSKTEIKHCAENNGGHCVTTVDGYFVEIGISTVFGVAWYLALSKMLKKLQSRRTSDWQVDDGGVVTRRNENETASCNLPDLVGGKSQKY